MSIRHMHIFGRLGSDPELRETSSGTSVASASVATETYHDDETVWVEVVCFGQTAEFFAEYGTKGSHCYARGRPEIDEWGDSAQLKLVADQIELPQTGAGDGVGESGPSSGDGEEYDEAFDDDDIPF